MKMKAYKKFRHAQFYEADYPELIDYFEALKFHGLLPDSRAALYDTSAYEGIRSALWIDLRGGADLPEQIHLFECLWLLELSNKKVFLYGDKKISSNRCIGGQKIENLDILDDQNLWVETLAFAFGNGVTQLADNEKYKDVFKCPWINRSEVIHMEMVLIEKAIKAFCEGLNQQALEALSSEGSGSTKTYNHYMCSSDIQRRNRMQAAIHNPWFAPMLRSNWQLKEVVDNGRPLTPALCKNFRVQERTIKHCRDLKPIKNSLPPEALMKLMDSFPAEYLPNIPEDKEVFAALAGELMDLANVLGVETHVLAKPFNNGWLSGKVSIEQRIGQAINYRSVFDMMQSVFQYGVKPLLETIYGSKLYFNRPPESWFSLWFGQYSLVRLLEMSQLWQESYAQFILQKLEIQKQKCTGQGIQWPTLFLNGKFNHQLTVEENNDVYYDRQYRIIELNSQQLLEQEGNRMQHCVSMYALDCLTSSYFIFSVRDNYGNSVSTFSVYFGKNDDGNVSFFEPVIDQHKRFKNEDPSDDINKVVSRFVEQILSDISIDELRILDSGKKKIAKTIEEKLEQIGDADGLLTSDELIELSSMVAFAHPKVARKQGVGNYIKQYSQLFSPK